MAYVRFGFGGPGDDLPIDQWMDDQNDYVAHGAPAPLKRSAAAVGMSLGFAAYDFSGDDESE